MSLYEIAKYTGLTTAGIIITGIAFLTYIGYRYERKIKKSEKRAKESALEKITNKK